MAKISVTGHFASKHGPTRLATTPCPDLPQAHAVAETLPHTAMIAVERHPAMYSNPQAIEAVGED
jgi:hypothetical protein